MTSTETVKKRLEALSYQHGFSKCGDIDVMTCNDTAEMKPTDKDIVKIHKSGEMKK